MVLIPIDKDLLAELEYEFRLLVQLARIYGKTNLQCDIVIGLLDRLAQQARLAVAINADVAVSPGGKAGLECPICHQVVDDADYWDGDRCLKCRLEGIGRPDLANILSKPMREPIPDDHLESDYEDRTCLPDNGE